MRKTVALLTLTMLLSGCSFLKRTFSGPGYKQPTTTAVVGDWLLRTPDSTSFVGADQVRLALEPGTFVITANYPAAEPVVIRGTVNIADDGVVTFMPGSGVSDPSSDRHAFRFVAGTPIELRASASGNTLVFAPANQLLDPTPSSVWHRYEAAQAAGLVTARAAPDTMRP